MHILLPPSESKRDGGAAGQALDLAALGFPSLNPARRRVLAEVRRLCTNRAAAASALGLSEQQYFEIDRNRTLRRSPVRPALDRYTGVLYDALGAGALDDAARDFAGRHLLIHSALFGLIRALDPIPAYRLSHNSRLPQLSLAKTWRTVIERELSSVSGLILDLRSESYVGLGRAPEGSVFIRVVSVEPDGARRALNHFNKHAKGELVRNILEARIDHIDVDSLLAWSAQQGICLEPGAPGELQLII